MRTMVAIAALTLLPALPAAAHHDETRYTDFNSTTPQQLHARLTAPAETRTPESAFHVTTPQELHARLTDPKAQPRDMGDSEDE